MTHGYSCLLLLPATVNIYHGLINILLFCVHLLANISTKLFQKKTGQSSDVQ